MESVLSAWLDVLQTRQSKGRFGSTERIQRRKTTKRAAPCVTTIEVMRGRPASCSSPAVFGSESTDVPRCKVAFLVNTATFGR